MWRAGPSLRKKKGAACSRVSGMEFTSPTSTVTLYSRSLGSCRRLLSPVSADRIAIAPASVIKTRHGILLSGSFQCFIRPFEYSTKSRLEGDWESNPNCWWIHQIYRIPDPIRAGTAGPLEILASVISSCISLYHYCAPLHSRTWRKYYDPIKNKKRHGGSICASLVSFSHHSPYSSL